MSRPRPVDTSAVPTMMTTAHGLACGPNGGPTPRHRISRNNQAKTSDTKNVPTPPTIQPSMSQPLALGPRPQAWPPSRDNAFRSEGIYLGFISLFTITWSYSPFLIPGAQASRQSLGYRYAAPAADT